MKTIAAARGAPSPSRFLAIAEACRGSRYLVILFNPMKRKTPVKIGN